MVRNAELQLEGLVVPERDEVGALMIDNRRMTQDGRDLPGAGVEVAELDSRPHHARLVILVLGYQLLDEEIGLGVCLWVCPLADLELKDVLLLFPARMQAAVELLVSVRRGDVLEEALDSLYLHLDPIIWDGAIGLGAKELLVLDDPTYDMDWLVGRGARDAQPPQVRVEQGQLALVKISLTVVCEGGELVMGSVDVAGVVHPIAVDDLIAAVDVIDAEGEYSSGDDIPWGAHELEHSGRGRVRDACPLHDVSVRDEVGNVLSDLVSAIAS